MTKKEIFKNNKGFLPLEHIPGEAQADFGDAEYYENGKLYSGKYKGREYGKKDPQEW